MFDMTLVFRFFLSCFIQKKSLSEKLFERDEVLGLRKPQVKSMEIVSIYRSHEFFGLLWV